MVEPFANSSSTSQLNLKTTSNNNKVCAASSEEEGDLILQATTTSNLRAEEQQDDQGGDHFISKSPNETEPNVSASKKSSIPSTTAASHKLITRAKRSLNFPKKLRRSCVVVAPADQDDPTPVPSSILDANSTEEIVNTAKKTLSNFFANSTSDHKWYKEQTEQYFIANYQALRKNLKKSLLYYETSLKECKRSIRVLKKSSAQLKQQQGMDDYLKSIKLIYQQAEHFHALVARLCKFIRKFSYLLISKQFDEYPEFLHFVKELEGVIETQGRSSVFPALVQQQTLLNQLQESVSQLELNSLYVSEFLEIPNRVVPEATKRFIKEITHLADQFCARIGERAGHHEKRIQFQENKFHQIIAANKKRYPLRILDGIRHKKCEPSVPPGTVVKRMENLSKSTSSSSEDVRSRRKKSSQEIGRSKDMAPFPNEIKKIFPSKDEQLLKLFNKWDKFLSNLFKNNTHMKNTQASFMKKISKESYVKADAYLSIHRVSCYMQIRGLQKSFINSLYGQLKSLKESGRMKNLPIPFELDDSHRHYTDAQKERLMNVQCLKAVQQNKKVLQTLVKWPTEFSSLMQLSGEKYSIIIQHNLKHIDPWLLRDIISQTADVILTSFSEEFDHNFQTSLDLMQSIQQQISNATRREKSSPSPSEHLLLHSYKREVLTNYNDFEIHFKTCVKQFDEQLKGSCQITHRFFQDQKRRSDRYLFHLQKSLQEFSRTRETVGLSSIVVKSTIPGQMSESDNPPVSSLAVEDTTTDAEFDTDFMPSAATSRKRRSSRSTTSRRRLWSQVVKNDDDNANAPTPVQPATSSAPEGKSEGLRNFQTAFLNKYIAASRMETQVPGWVKEMSVSNSGIDSND